jgi:hypothetical protein|tara:strand:- start:86 stop:595 length:510 start_codon:yes stop_codon:yes gene_type:complete
VEDSAYQVVQQLPVRIRKAYADDAPFIYKSWVQSYQGQNKDIPKKAITRMHKGVIKRLLEQSTTVVACGDSAETENDIYSWLTAKRTSKFLVVHFAYTKAPFRRWGLLNSLLKVFEYKQGEAILASHKSYIIKELKPKHNIMYVPHLQMHNGLEDLENLYETQHGDIDV